MLNRSNLMIIFALAIFGMSSGLFGCASSPRTTSPESLMTPPGLLAKNAKHQKIPLTKAISAHRFTYPNGLQLFIVEDHTSPTFAYQTWFKVGSRDEILGKTGLAHLFEHMMFKETKNLKEGEFDRILESSGAEGENAFTSRDFTAYIQELPKDKLELIARLESERMVNLIVNEVAFKTETEVVQNERRFRNENNPDGLMYQELFEQAYKKHPYRWPVIGYQKDLEAMSGQDALAFYRSFYSPSNAVIVIAGDVDAEEAAAVIEKYYGHLKPQLPEQHRIPPEPLQKAPRKKTLKLNIQVQKLLLAYPIPDIKNEDIPAILVFQSILSNGKSSRLHQALVEKGISTGVDSFGLDDKDPSLFIVATNLQQGKKAPVAEGVILSEIARLRDQPVDLKEIERAKNKIHFDFYQALESNYLKAHFIGLFESIAGDFRVAIQHHDNINVVSSVDVQRVARKYFNPNSRTVIIGAQKK